MVLLKISNRLRWLGYALVLSFLSAGNVQAMEKAQLTTAPNVPAPIKRTSPATVVIKFEAKEYVGELADGKKYKFWSFNGTVPGPMARVRVGDTVEFHLSNHKDSVFPHNIDLHAVNGPGGGAELNLVGPGDTAVFQFKALNPGLYIYHCASPIPNIPAHIANGMYGLILVEPENGLTKVDHEFYVLQSEFFTKPSDIKGVLELSMEKGLADHPDYVVFNGRDGALMGDNALKAKAGDTVRIYFGNIGPNGTSSFHVIGEIFDNVNVEGSLDGLVNHNVQTTLVPSAGAVIVEFKIDVPGDYLLVDHSIFRVAKGAIGIITATGKEDPSVFKSIK
ncbi:MAG: nitrite reductase, copper-containing [Nitrospinae bacterium]|nr:nitrite reductase, copper-containing [Nitrospinota bacterium]